MIDCRKSLPELTPYEAWRCFLEADDWKIVGGNLRRMWTDFTGTTIGEWGMVVVAFAAIPAILASYLWPLLLVGSLFTGSWPKYTDKRTRLFGWYMIAAGTLLLLANSTRDTFIFYQGTWIFVCGASMVLMVVLLGKRVSVP